MNANNINYLELHKMTGLYQKTKFDAMKFKMDIYRIRKMVNSFCIVN